MIGDHWQEYYAQTANRPPSPFLQKAVAYFPSDREHSTALDLGCGSGSATSFLLDQGFRVTAVDQHAAALEFVRCLLPNERLSCVQSDFETFSFEHYHLIHAQHALPFLSLLAFDKVWSRIQQALIPGGIFVGSFFGIHDGWYETSHHHMTFLEKKSLEIMFHGWSSVSLTEQEGKGSTVGGGAKYWHIFYVIAQQKGKME